MKSFQIHPVFDEPNVSEITNPLPKKMGLGLGHQKDVVEGTGDTVFVSPKPPCLQGVHPAHRRAGALGKGTPLLRIHIHEIEQQSRRAKAGPEDILRSRGTGTKNQTDGLLADQGIEDLLKRAIVKIGRGKGASEEKGFETPLFALASGRKMVMHTCEGKIYLLHGLKISFFIDMTEEMGRVTLRNELQKMVSTELFPLVWGERKAMSDKDSLFHREI
jgi:hypothetical protein